MYPTKHQQLLAVDEDPFGETALQHNPHCSVTPSRHAVLFHPLHPQEFSCPPPFLRRDPAPPSFWKDSCCERLPLMTPLSYKTVKALSPSKAVLRPSHGHIFFLDQAQISQILYTT